MYAFMFDIVKWLLTTKWWLLLALLFAWAVFHGI
jgi:hypothetical protein